MGSVSLRRLTLFNFRSFVGRHELSFPESGLVILRGDSGAGKTNLLLALKYLLGVCQFPVKALQCWHDDAPMYVEGVFALGGQEVVVRRGVKGLAIGGLKGRAAEGELDRLCGAPAELREILTYRDQVKPKKFLGMRDGLLKEFLIQVLGLHELEREVAAASGFVAARAGELQVHQGVLDYARAALAEYQVELFVPQDTGPLEATLALTRLALDKVNGEALGLAEDLAAAEAAQEAAQEAAGASWEERAAALRSDLMAKRHQTHVYVVDLGEVKALEAKLAECKRYLDEFEACDAAGRAAYAAQHAVWQKEARHLHNELARLPDLQEDTRRLKQEAEALNADLCDRCGRVWPNAQEQYLAHLKLIEALEAKVAQIAQHQPRAQQLEAMLALPYQPDSRLEQLRQAQRNLQQALAAAEQKVDHEKALERARFEAGLREQELALQEAERAARSARESYPKDPELDGLRKRARALLDGTTTLTLEVKTLEGQLALARQANHHAQVGHDQQVKKLGELEQKAAAARVAYEVADEAHRAEVDCYELLRSFRDKIFDEVLEAIGTEATAIIEALPNAQHIGLEFRSERALDKGGTKHEIKPVVYLHGVERALDESVSGGQLTSVDLAVDLAVARVISGRLGCHLNWLVLDEAFNGHDTATKASCLEMLQRYAADKLVLIVDHTSEFKELFAQTITVVLEHNQSRVV